MDPNTLEGTLARINQLGRSLKVGFINQEQFEMETSISVKNLLEVKGVDLSKETPTPEGA